VKKLFVIVVTYNGRQWYDNCFGSIQRSTKPVQAVVVDNASDDDTIKYIETNYPEIYLIKNEKNVGFGRANNRGIEYALRNGCDYVYLLNQDAWVEADTFEILINLAEKYPEYGIISPLHINSQETGLDKNFQQYISKTVYISDVILKRTISEIYSCDFINAAHWLITRACLNRVGGFSPVFPHYGEDANYVHRVMYHKLKIGFTPLSKGVHAREYRIEGIEKIIYMNYITFLIRVSDINKQNSYLYALCYFWAMSFYYLIKYKNISVLKYMFKPFVLWLPVLKQNVITRSRRSGA
jgi:GT2 family glycosyltransferase